MKSVTALPSVAAVIVTRNRVDLLRQTIASIKLSTYPINEMIVSDDSTNQETLKMLASEFPDVIHVEGFRRGRSANRNRAMGAASSDYILLSDDDIVVDPHFIERAIQEIAESKASLVFTGTSEHGQVIFPNTLNFLGFSTKSYKPGQSYNTANSHCYLISRQLARQLSYDEVIVAYGYEEMDYAYRVAAAGFQIQCISSCANIHLAPNTDKPFQTEQDACRLYVTYKRLAYVDKRPFQSILFLFIAIPHHLLASIRRNGTRGVLQATSNFRLAARMLKTYRRQTKQEALVAE